VTNDPLIPVDGHLRVRRVDVDDEAWQRVAADEQTESAWQGRLAAVQHARGAR
jgi:hypothetical protein